MQSSQIGILTTTGTEQASAANSLLSNARLIREQLARESMDSNHKLSEAVLMVVMYIEKVESTARLLALADTCIGKIRARMRVNGIPINVPSDEVPVLSDAGEIDQG